MGLISGLLMLPVAPVRGVIGIAEVLYRQAQSEFADPAAVRGRLAALEQARAAGELTEEEAAEQEEELVRLLWEARAADRSTEV